MYLCSLLEYCEVIRIVTYLSVAMTNPDTGCFSMILYRCFMYIDNSIFAGFIFIGKILS